MPDAGDSVRNVPGRALVHQTCAGRVNGALPRRPPAGPRGADFRSTAPHPLTSRWQPLAAVLALLLAAVPGCKDEPKEPNPTVPIEPIDGPNADLDRPGEGTGSLDPTELASPAGPVQEEEPNDGREMASPLPINGAIRAALTRKEDDNTRDEDWFVLTLPAGNTQQVRIQLSPQDESDYVLRWMPAEPIRGRKSRKGRRIKDAPLAKVDNAGDGGVEVLPPMVLGPGQHYFKVTAIRKKKRRRRGTPPPQEPWERPYRLSSTVVDPDPRVEQEPNATRETASVLRPGDAREGYLGWHQDSDWYRLDLEGAEAGGLLRIDLTGVTDVKSRLWLTDKRGKSLVKAPEPKVRWEPGRGVTIRDVGIEPDRLPYYVQVKATNSANPHERYTLTARVESGEGDREREPNWKPQNATRLDGGTPLEGYIGHPTDWDTYSLQSESPMVGTVTVSGIEGVDLRLEYIDSNLKIAGQINEGGLGAGETLPTVSVGPRAVYVRLSSKDHTFNVDQSYRIEVELTDARGRELEPNDGFDDGRRVVLGVGDPVKGLIHPRGDLDYYALDISAPNPDDTRQLQVRLSGIEGTTLAVFLYDSERTLITRKGGIGGGETRGFTHSFTPGRYYLSVRADSPDAADAEREYTLEVVE